MDIASQISRTDYDLDYFVRLALTDEAGRVEIIKQMLHNENIMVYYHCYEVISHASAEQPSLFYEYWADILPLLNHRNSYHRDIALTILANLTAVDTKNRFESIFADYFSHTHDEKFMTACCCVDNSKKIVRNKPHLKNQITELLLQKDGFSCYSTKQAALMMSYVLDLLEQAYPGEIEDPTVRAFILREQKSNSPKTRQKAKELSKKI